jgi:hypothetical protein
MKEIVVTNQIEMDAVPKDFDGLVIIKVGTPVDPINVSTSSGSATVRASGSATVRASGSATVYASGSATVYASGSATVRASDSATVYAFDSATVYASDSATVRASGSATVRASGSATVYASKWAIVRTHRGHKGTATGGIIVTDPAILTASDWCEYHGVTVKDGVAIVYKAVRDDYKSQYGLLYPVGGSAEATDWDGGEKECGGGLHFSPSPSQAKSFDEKATRFLACPVALEDMRNPKEDDQYSSKIKARRICGPIIEVGWDGKPLMAAKE